MAHIIILRDEEGNIIGEIQTGDHGDEPSPEGLHAAPDEWTLKFNEDFLKGLVEKYVNNKKKKDKD